MPKTLGPHAGGPGRGIGFWAQPAIIQAQVPATLMPLPFDWGTPEGPQYALPPWNSTTPLTIVLASLVKPFKQTEWPLPRDYLRSPPSWTVNLLQSTLRPIPPDLITRPFDWGTPEGPRQPDFSWVLGASLTLRGIVQAPFNQEDWPVPQAPQRPSNLSVWTWSYNLNLIGQDSLPIGERIIDRPQLIAIPPENVKTWLWNYNLNLIGKDRLPSGEIITDRPQLAAVPPENIKTWTWTYNLNLIGQDALPVGERVTDTARGPAQPDRGFTVSYNLNLIGQDALPVGERVIDLPARQITDLKTWWQSVNLLLATPIIPITPPLWPFPQAFQQPDRGFTASYNLNLIGQDVLPFRNRWEYLFQPGEGRSWTQSINLALTTVQVPFVVQMWPLPQPVQQPQRGWGVSFNLNLIGQDQLPTGKDVLDLPPQPPLSAIQLRTWIQTVNLALTAPGRPFNQQDWPLNTGPRQPTQIFTAFYNPNLIGQDQLPFRQDKWPLTPAAVRAADLGTWISQVKLLLVVPFNQTDWPVPAQKPPAARTWTWQYNQNLIGQDVLPTGVDLTGLPPQPALSSIQLRTWIQSVNLALTVTPPLKPVNQQDWPLNTGPQQPIQVFTASFNKNLIGQDQLPFRQQDWPVPTPRPRPLDLVAWIDRSKFYLQSPNRQLDWPVPRGYQQPALSYTASYNPNLIGKDLLPNRQQDWPLPRDARRPDNRRPHEFVAGINLALFFPPGPMPHDQFDWPLAGAWALNTQRHYNRTFISDHNINLFPVPPDVNPIPPPPDPTPPDPSTRQPNPGIEWQFYDRAREPGPIGWR